MIKNVANVRRPTIGISAKLVKEKDVPVPISPEHPLHMAHRRLAEGSPHTRTLLRCPDLVDLRTTVAELFLVPGPFLRIMGEALFPVRDLFLLITVGVLCLALEVEDRYRLITVEVLFLVLVLQFRLIIPAPQEDPSLLITVEVLSLKLRPDPLRLTTVHKLFLAVMLTDLVTAKLK